PYARHPRVSPMAFGRIENALTHVRHCGESSRTWFPFPEAEASLRSGEPWKDRSQSLASSIAHRAFLLGRGGSPRERTHLLVSSAICLRAWLSWTVRLSVSQARCLLKVGTPTPRDERRSGSIVCVYCRGRPVTARHSAIATSCAVIGRCD